MKKMSVYHHINVWVTLGLLGCFGVTYAESVKDETSRWFMDYDKNKDNRISKEEMGVKSNEKGYYGPSVRAVFSAMDENNDGFLSKSEVSHFLIGEQKNPEHARYLYLFAELDMDEDRGLLKDEFSKLEINSDLFEEYDQNQDRFLSKEEFLQLKSRKMPISFRRW
jgi:Ca2+-binding EF-hand superfamily protein